jgi:hypothetical protein
VSTTLPAAEAIGARAAAAAPDAAAPPLAATQEVRFAVVMYGGVSLAIYINGVARELFRLVQVDRAGATEGSSLRVPCGWHATASGGTARGR